MYVVYLLFYAIGGVFVCYYVCVKSTKCGRYYIYSFASGEGRLILFFINHIIAYFLV